MKYSRAAMLLSIAATSLAHAQSAGQWVVNAGWMHLAPQDSSQPLTVNALGQSTVVPGSGSTLANANTARQWFLDQGGRDIDRHFVAVSTAVERVRAQIVSGLRRESTNPNNISSKLWWRTAFPNHPYGRPSGGTLESLPLIQPEDLRAYHQRNLARDNLKIAVVGDIDASTRFYRDILGLELETVMPIPSDRVTIAFLPVGEVKIELVCPTDETTGVARFLASKGEGFHHVCFEVEDIEQAYIQSWKIGAKAISIYRDGSKRTQPLRRSQSSTRKCRRC